jgi:peptidoglycan/LPS O-acetylase OafA/YrhL
VVAYRLHATVTPRLAPLFWILFVGAVVVCYVIIEDLIPGVHHRALQWGVCLSVGIAIPFFRQMKLAPLKLVSHAIAKYSYGIYLFHCIALWLGCVKSGLPPAMAWPVALGLVIVVPVICYHLLEKPGIQLGSALAKQIKRADARLAGDSVGASAGT